MLSAIKEAIKKKKKPKIRLSFYPYTYVRTTVMRTLLLKKDDYHKILKMDFNEIARFLEDTSYKNSIDKLAESLSGAELIEIALNRDLADSFAKLRRISSEELRLLINEYLKRKDIEDIKTIIRGKFTSADGKTIEKSIQGVGTLSKDYLLMLFKKESVKDVLKGIHFINFENLETAYEKFKKDNTIFDIENELDRCYYNSLLEFAERLKQGELFRDFLIKEIEIANMLTIIKLKYAKMDNQAISSFVFFTDNASYNAFLKRLIESDINLIIKISKKLEYGEIISSGLKSFENTGSLIELETSLHKYLLKKSILLLHQHPLSIDVILGYMFAKDIEVKNLKIIVKGKQLGLKEEFIEKQLVF